MKKIETFIFVHDQDIVLDFMNKNRFDNLKDFKYVFLGNKEYSKIKNLENLIISKNLTHQIENYPKLTSFTGWYSLYKNGLIDSDYVNFFEYDINTNKDIDKIISEIVEKNDVDFIGYNPMYVRDPVYVNMNQYSKELINALKEDGIDIIKLLDDKNTDGNLLWSSSSNSTWKVEHLFNFVDWFMKYFNHIVKSNYMGHIHERSISFYYFLNNLNVFLTNGLIEHVQLNSHNTSPLPIERSKQMYKKLK